MEELFDKIIKSKKYSGICADTIRRIIIEQQHKYKKEADVIKSVKNKLHQISLSFFSDEENKLIKKFYSEEHSIGDFSNLLRLHSSTCERLDFYSELYNDIFNVAKNASTIIDIACGLNPILLGMYFCHKNMPIKNYYCEDINVKAVELSSKFFSLAGLPLEGRVSDILLDIPTVEADVALLFKLIPLLEQQKKGYFSQLIDSLNAKYIVVSFPTKTMSGKNVGMIDSYKKLFEGFVAKNHYDMPLCKNYENELMYIISKN